MKVIFLDIDGVMVTEKSVRGYHDTQRFLPSCVEKLDELVRRTDAKIVTSNPTKTGDNLLVIQKVFKKNGMKNIHALIGTTKIVPENHDKYIEITNWLKENEKVDKFVVIDDVEISELVNNQILVDYTNGLANVNTNEVLRKFR